MRTLITALALAAAAFVAAPASATVFPACQGVTSQTARNACASMTRDYYSEGGEHVQSSGNGNEPDAPKN